MGLFYKTLFVQPNPASILGRITNSNSKQPTVQRIHTGDLQNSWICCISQVPFRTQNIVQNELLLFFEFISVLCTIFCHLEECFQSGTLSQRFEKLTCKKHLPFHMWLDLFVLLLDCFCLEHLQIIETKFSKHPFTLFTHTFEERHCPNKFVSNSLDYCPYVPAAASDMYCFSPPHTPVTLFNTNSNVLFYSNKGHADVTQTPAAKT